MPCRLARRSPASRVASAACEDRRSCSPERSATSSSDYSPSDWFSTQSIASCSSRAAATAGRRVEASLPELRLALGERLTYRAVASRTSRIASSRVKSVLELLGPDELEVVGRRVVLGVLALARPAEAADREVEAGELNCRSSQPHGTKSTTRPPRRAGERRARPRGRRGVAAAAPLVGERRRSPTHATTSPCRRSGAAAPRSARAT